MTNRILCHEHETLVKLNFFKLMESHCSWDSVLISIYQIDTYDLKTGNVHAKKRWKNAFRLGMNSPLVRSVGGVCCLSLYWKGYSPEEDRWTVITVQASFPKIANKITSLNLLMHVWFSYGQIMPSEMYCITLRVTHKSFS